MEWRERRRPKQVVDDRNECGHDGFDGEDGLDDNERVVIPIRTRPDVILQST